MITTTNSKGNEGIAIFRRASFLSDEAVWQFALVSVVLAALCDGVASLGAGSIG
jgi:hypothetical protein